MPTCRRTCSRRPSTVPLLLSRNTISRRILLAAYIKKEFDKKYYPTFNNPVCLQGQETPPALGFGSVGSN